MPVSSAEAQQGAGRPAAAAQGSGTASAVPAPTKAGSELRLRGAWGAQGVSELDPDRVKGPMGLEQIPSENPPIIP